MKAFQIALQPVHSDSTLIPCELPVPTPNTDEVVVRVRAVGVTPTELLWYPSSHNKDGSQRKGAVPGHEFSGVVTAVGREVSRFKIGDEVFGMNDWFQNGATAEFCTASESDITSKPSNVSHELAAATPISILTAFQGLVEQAKIKRGDRVLVVGASGSVGLLAVQIASLHGGGGVVFGSGSAEAEAKLKILGCQQIFDYRSQPFQQHLRDVDIVFDTVGGDTLACASKILSAHGRMVTIAADAEGSTDPLIKGAFFTVEASGKQLEQMARLVEAGTLQPFVKAVLPLAEAPQAYSTTFRATGLGKLVLSTATA